jgi:glycosyltransferase involved in cell wall biosynthesis
MKILYVGHTYTVRSNQAKIVALARLPDVEITLVTPQGWRGPLYSNKTEKFDNSLAPNVDHHIVRAFFTGREGAYFFSPAIFPLIKRVQPDIVHVEQGAYALSYCQILWGLKLFSPQSKALFFTWWNLPYRLRGLKRRAQDFNFAYSSCAIAGNEAAKSVLREQGFAKPVHVLPQLGIDLSAYSGINAEEHRLPGSFTIGYAGRISEEKGVLDLVRAAGQMKNKSAVSLYFVGAGEALDKVKQEAEQCGLPLVHHPAVLNDDLPRHLSIMDVLVLPSHSTPGWVEQFGHILIEAMAAGVPVVGSSSGEIPNVIGKAGLIFTEGNTNELAKCLDLLEENETERKRLIEAGRTRVRDNFTNEKIADMQFQIYESMMLEKAGVPKAAARTENASQTKR